MDRKKFISTGVKTAGIFMGMPAFIEACSSNDESPSELGADCKLSPDETAGPFPIKSPADLVKANIISDRKGLALMINITVQRKSKACKAEAGLFVDIWQCDADGQYSEYGGTRMQQADLRNQHFLRGRQTTDANGKVSFLSIYPGWYPGRAPHIHLEVLNTNGKSLKVTQIAFPEDINAQVFKTANYQGKADTSNARDGIFSNSLVDNMADKISGNNSDGYVLEKNIVI